MEVLTALASNKMFIGFAMLMMNMGSRFVIMDIGKAHEALLTNPIVKKIVVFCMFFVATRDIMVAAILSFAFSVIVHGLLHEKSRFSMIPKSMLAKLHMTTMHATSQRVSVDEYTNALATIERYRNA
jgi:hypothetical protein